MMPASNRVARSGVTMLATSIVVLLLNAVTALVVARELGPAEFALWGIVALIGGYSVWSQLGAFNGMNREVPRLEGQGQSAVASEIRASAMIVGSATALILAAALVTTGLVMRALSYPMWNAVVIAAPFVIVRQVWVYLGTVYRAHQDFVFVAEFQVVSAVTSTAAGIPLVLYFGFEGFVIGQIIAYVVTCLYAVGRRGYAVVVARPSGEQIRALVGMGFPIWLGGLMNELACSVDRIVGLAVLSPAAYGIYSLTPFMRQAAGLPSRSLAEVVYPRLSQRVGEGETTGVLRSLLVRQDATLAFTMPLLLGLVYVSLPTVVPLALPGYVSGIETLGIYSLALCWWSLFSAGNGLNALGLGRTYAWILALTAVVSGVSGALLSVFMPSGSALPIGVGAAGMVGSIVTMYAAQRAAGALLDEAVHHAASVTVPVILSIAVAALAGRMFEGSSLIAFAARVATLCVAAVPILWFGERRFGVLGMMLSSMRRSMLT